MNLQEILWEMEILEVAKALKEESLNEKAEPKTELSNSNVVKSYAQRMGRPNALADLTVVWRCLEKKYNKNWGLINKIFTNWAKKWTAGKVHDIKKSQTKKTKTHRPASDESYEANIAKYKKCDF